MKTLVAPMSTEKDDSLRLAPPWCTFYKEVYEMFKNDAQVRVRVAYVDDKHDIRLYVDDAMKAAALEKLIGGERDFGGQKIQVSIIPPNSTVAVSFDTDNGEEGIISLYKEALAGNPAYCYSTKVDSFGFTANYIVFRREVVQFENDDLSDIDGMCSTLYEDIARDIFHPMAGVFFCTDSRIIRYRRLYNRPTYCEASED